MGKKFSFLAIFLINLTYAIRTNQLEVSSSNIILSKRQGLNQYGYLQPIPDPPFQPQFQGNPQTFQSQNDFSFTPGFSQPAIQPVAQPVVQPDVQPVVQQAVQPAVQPVIQPAVQPVAQPTQPQAAQFTFQCDQTIMGRNLEYSSALQLIQNEDYLDDSDIDELRFFQRQGRFIETNKKQNQSLNRVKRQTVNTIPDINMDPQFQDCQNFDCLGIPVLLVVLIGFIASQPTPGDIPANSPQPGEPGGGGLPTPGNPALALVPLGLEAVSVFPPFAFPRTVQAIGAIFKEAPGTVPGVDPLYRKKRSPYGQRRNPIQTLLARLRKNLKCLGPRLTRKFGRKPNSHTTYGYEGRKKRDYSTYEESFDINTIEDCFADIPAPRFGYVVKISYTRRGPPTLRDYFSERQTGEGFTSAAPPDCRINTY